jgi:uncharacterized membrane protein YesL
MNRIFGSESKLIFYLTKIGQIITLTALFLLCCIPIITLGTSITSYYYAMIKSKRRERGYPTTEFLQSFRRNFVKGSVVTIGIAVIVGLLYVNREYVAKSGSVTSPAMVITYDILFILLLLLVMFIFPAMSRFSLKLTSLLRLSLIMALRHLPSTIALTAGVLFCGILLLYVVPIPFIVVLPGVWCYASTYLVEPVLRKYMPEPKEGEDAWYYE